MTKLCIFLILSTFSFILKIIVPQYINENWVNFTVALPFNPSCPGLPRGPGSPSGPGDPRFPFIPCGPKSHSTMQNYAVTLHYRLF